MVFLEVNLFGAGVLDLKYPREVHASKVCLVSKASRFCSGILKQSLDHGGFGLVNRSTYLWIHSLMGYWEALKTLGDGA